MRWISLFFAGSLTFSSLKALFFFDPNTNLDSRPVVLAISVLGAAVFFFIFFKSRREKNALSEFESWLKTNREKVLASGALYNGTRITGDTEVTRFMLAASFVYISVKTPSRYYIAGRDNIGFAKTMYTL
ncbi:MAG: hypothetical protein ACTS8S_12230, partial [Giesbergeria sp.]